MWFTNMGSCNSISALQISQNLLSMPNEPDIQLGFLLKFLIRGIKIMYRVLIRLLTCQFAIIRILFKSKNNLVLETIELRQQLMIYQTKKEDSKNITDLTRSLLVALKRAWPKWMDSLIIVKPETVVYWQRKRFKNFGLKNQLKRISPVCRQ